MASCPRITDLKGDINDTKTTFLDLNPSCRGVTIYNYVADRMADIIDGL